MPAIRSHTLSESPDELSPAGVAEIRQLLSYPAGELTHARVTPGGVSRPSRVFPSAEWFYVLGGHGQIWDGGSAGGRILDLLPGRLVRIAPGTPFQYRAIGNDTLDLLLAVMPQWRPSYHGVLDLGGAWEPTGQQAGAGDRRGQLPVDPASLGITTYDPSAVQPQTAPDGSTVWPLGSEPAGGVAVCTLTPGAVTIPVRHRTVEEIWFVLSGTGEISRRHGSRDPYIEPLTASTCVDVALGLTFQFRCTGAEELRMVLLTMPQWPGEGEAVATDELATWEPSVRDLS